MAVSDKPSQATSDNDNDTLKDFIKDIPKVELHAHLNGCIRETTLFELSRQHRIKLSHHHYPSVSPTELLSSVRPRSLKDCFDMFEDIAKCVNNLASLERITREALEDFDSHNVVYLELRTTPKRLKQESGELCTKRQYLETVVNMLESFEKERENGLVPRLIVSVDRSGSVEQAMEHVQLAIDMKDNPYIVGVDLGGNPTKNDFRDFQAAFAMAREAGLYVTLHCGEVPCDEGENETHSSAYMEAKACIEFRPDRLGHALLLPNSLQSLLDTMKIPVETCPTSNVMTLELATQFHGNLVQGLERHPQLGYWLQTEYPISVSTDDSGVFHTDPTKELLLLTMAYKSVNERTLERIALQSMRHAFCDEVEKKRLECLIARRFQICLKRLESACERT